MTEIVIGIFVFLSAILLMSVGVLFGRRGISGGCGHACRIPGVRPLCSGACRYSPSQETPPPNEPP